MVAVRADPATRGPDETARPGDRRAATLVEPGSAIAISAGTTTHTLARHLGAIPDLTVITNSARVAEVLEQSGPESMTVLLTGGQRTPSDALVGTLAVAAWRSLHVDTCFLGVHGMHPETGFTTPNLLEAETNRAMIGSASRLVVVADSSKWGTVGLSTMAELHEANVIVTDVGIGDEAAAILTGEIDEVVLVDPGEGAGPGRGATSDDADGPEPDRSRAPDLR